jgi:aryl-alcohol dehydrogenase-like predicted oxidoreductase
MEYVKFGNAGIVVSRLCWGAMTFYEREGDEAGIRMVHEALGAGINFFDTADAYGKGKSEEIMGRALKAKRDHIVLATKLWVPMYPEDQNGRGCGRYHMMRAVEDSLRRLGTDRIDLYQLHHPDINAPVEETLSTLDTLIKQGKIRYFGVSNHFAWQMAHMLGVSALHEWEPLMSIQCHYNIFNRAVESETQHFCKRFNIAAITYGPLSAGVLSGKIKRGAPLPEGGRLGGQGLKKTVAGGHRNPAEDEQVEKVFDIIDELEVIADKYNIGINQLAVKWVLSKDWVTCPILGGSRAEHYTPMYKLFDFEVDAGDLKRIDDISDSFKYVPFGNQPIVGGAATQLNRW